MRYENNCYLGDSVDVLIYDFILLGKHNLKEVFMVDREVVVKFA